MQELFVLWKWKLAAAIVCRLSHHISRALLLRTIKSNSNKLDTDQFLKEKGERCALKTAVGSYNKMCIGVIHTVSSQNIILE